MTPDQVDRIISSLNALHAEADQVIDAYVAHIRERDGLQGIPEPTIRQAQIENRAGWAMDLRNALELIRQDIGGLKAAPANAVPSVPTLFQSESGVSEVISPREAALRLKQQRKNQ
jgi:hypothetical protein